MQKVSECCDAPMNETLPDICTECHEHCGSYELYDCDECEDTGEVPNLVWNDDVKEFREDGMKPCICKNNF